MTFKYIFNKQFSMAMRHKLNRTCTLDDLPNIGYDFGVWTVPCDCDYEIFPKIGYVFGVI